MPELEGSSEMSAGPARLGFRGQDQESGFYSKRTGSYWKVVKGAVQ